MNKTTNYEFNIPYKADNESADIDPISDNFVTIDTELAKKVDKVEGKGLSTNDYTDTDKSIVDNAQEALAGKLDKITDGDYQQELMVYGIAPAPGGSFEQVMWPIIRDFDPDTTADALPYYGAGGTLKVGTPATQYDAANKGYVDSGLAGKLDKVTPDEVDYFVYGTGPGVQSMYGIVTDAQGLIPRYTLNTRRLYVDDPMDEYDATNKKYVDNAIASAITTTLNTEV